jgi:hypothetical protein
MHNAKLEIRTYHLHFADQEGHLSSFSSSDVERNSVLILFELTNRFKFEEKTLADLILNDFILF